MVISDSTSSIVVVVRFLFSSREITLRLCLTFEEVDCIEPIQELSIRDLKVDNKELYWLVNISDFEKIIYLMANNYEKLKKIIKQKMMLEQNQDKNGRSFE